MSEPPENVDVTSLKNEFLECPVCVEYFNNTNRRARLLKYCLHGFCTECIDQLLKKDGRGQLTCPICRHVEKVEGKATSLPADPVRSKLVDFLHMKRQKKIKCTDCPDGNDADGRCDECQMYLCNECINAHKRNRSSRDHNITAIEDALEVPIREFSQGHFCPKHPKHHIEFYCTTDEELCCLSCTVIDHKGHEFEKIQDAAAKRKSSVHESLQDVYKTKTTLQQRQNVLKAKRNAVEKMKKQSERNINKMIDDMKLQLDQRRNQLLSELQQESSAMLLAIEKSSAAYDTTLSVIESTDTYFAQTKEKADDVEMLQMYPAIRRSVDALQSQPVAPDVRINEGGLKFLPTQKRAFDGLASQLGAFGRQDSPPQAVQSSPDFADADTRQSGCLVAQGKSLNLKVYKGDLTTITADVIVRLVHPDLSSWDVDYESVGAAAGSQLSDQIQRIIRMRGPASPGSVVVTDAGRLPCKKIFNFVCPCDNREFIIKCLCEVIKRKLTSIAFPCFQFAPAVFIQAVKSVDMNVTGESLQEVHFVSANDWQFSKWGEATKKAWTQVSDVQQEDVDMIRKYLHTCSGVLPFEVIHSTL